MNFRDLMNEFSRLDELQGHPEEHKVAVSFLTEAMYSLCGRLKRRNMAVLMVDDPPPDGTPLIQCEVQAIEGYRDYMDGLRRESW